MADFPTIEGEYRLNGEWEIVLPLPFQRRFEDAALIVWRPGVTVRVECSVEDHERPKDARLQRIRQDSASGAFDVRTETNGAVLRYAYRVEDKGADGRPHVFHGYSIGLSGTVHVAVHFDRESDLETALSIWRGLREVGPPTGGCA
jgi:hypothetical protein